MEFRHCIRGHASPHTITMIDQSFIDSQTWFGLFYFTPIDLSYLRALEYTQQDVEWMMDGDLDVSEPVNSTVGGWPLVADTEPGRYNLCYFPPEYRRPVAILESQRRRFGDLADDRIWAPLPKRALWKKIARMWLGCIHHVLSITSGELQSKLHDGCPVITTPPKRLPQGLRLCGIDTLLALIRTWRVFNDLNGEIELPRLTDPFPYGTGTLHVGHLGEADLLFIPLDWIVAWEDEIVEIDTLQGAVVRSVCQSLIDHIPHFMDLLTEHHTPINGHSHDTTEDDRDKVGNHPH